MLGIDHSGVCEVVEASLMASEPLAENLRARRPVYTGRQPGCGSRV